jgi:two-component system sensor histidine kinase RegB
VSSAIASSVAGADKVSQRAAAPFSGVDGGRSIRPMRMSPWWPAMVVAGLFAAAAAVGDHRLAHAVEAFAAAFAVFLVVRLGVLLSRREAALAEAAAERARAERLTALATLAAGAAHELATPLSVLGRQLERLAASAPPSAASDVAAARAELERCRAILGRLAAHGDGQATVQRVVTADALIAALRPAAIRPEVIVDFHVEPGAERLELPLDLVVEAAGGVVKNAVQAARARVDVVIARDDRGTQVVVADDGPGLQGAAAVHAGEPFFTTRPDGTGLGLFLARVVCERLGGALVVDSGPEGTSVLLDVPRGVAP